MGSGDSTVESLINKMSVSELWSGGAQTLHLHVQKLLSLLLMYVLSFPSFLMGKFSLKIVLMTRKWVKFVCVCLYINSAYIDYNFVWNAFNIQLSVLSW